MNMIYNFLSTLVWTKEVILFIMLTLIYYDAVITIRSQVATQIMIYIGGQIADDPILVLYMLYLYQPAF